MKQVDALEAMLPGIDALLEDNARIFGAITIPLTEDDE